jgi:hypothetical protein
MAATVVAERKSDIPLLITGIALIVVPVLWAAIELPLLTFGWGWFILLFVFPELLWVLQIVIAATGFFGRGGAFAGSRNRVRGIAAAWVALGALIAAPLFGWVDVGGLQGLLTFVLPIAAIVWLTVEWIIALVQRNRARSVAAAA